MTANFIQVAVVHNRQSITLRSVYPSGNRMRHALSYSSGSERTVSLGSYSSGSATFDPAVMKQKLLLRHDDSKGWATSPGPRVSIELNSCYS